MHYHEQAMEDERQERHKEFWKKIVEYRKERAKRVVLILKRSLSQTSPFINGEVVGKNFLSKSLFLPTYREQANSIERHINSILQ